MTDPVGERPSTGPPDDGATRWDGPDPDRRVLVRPGPGGTTGAAGRRRRVQRHAGGFSAEHPCQLSADARRPEMAGPVANRDYARGDDSGMTTISPFIFGCPSPQKWAHLNL